MVFVGKERNTNREIRVWSTPLALQVNDEPLLRVEINRGDWMCAAREVGGAQCMMAYVNGFLYIAYDVWTHEKGDQEQWERLMRAAVDAKALPRDW